MKTTDKYVFFWGGIYSQWYKRNMHAPILNITFNCSEQYMMYQKALLFDDKEIMAKILEETDPAKHKGYGRKVKNFDSAYWDEHKFNIVSNACMLKFTQNYDLLKALLETDKRILVEASPKDKIWGIGMHENDYGVEDETNWKGENLLGYALTDTRDFIKKALLSKDNLYHIGDE